MMQTSRITFADNEDPIQVTEPSADSSTPQARSPAQQEASRLNGSRGTGPKTAEGKIRSRMNSLSHGVFAMKLRPPKDGRHEDREYDHLLAQLQREFCPATITERNYVEAMAGDWMQLRRLLRLRESVMAPSLEEVGCTMSATRCLLDVEYELKTLDTLVRNCGEGVTLNCPKDGVERLVRAGQKLIQESMEIVAEFRQLQAKKRKKIDPELREAAESAIAGRVEGFDTDDKDTLRAVLTGSILLDESTRPRWIWLLRSLNQAKACELRGERRQQETYDRNLQQSHSKLLDRLPTLELLTRYETNIRRKIERTVQHLERHGQQTFSAGFVPQNDIESV